MITLLAVAAGGAGAVARYGIGVAVQRRFPRRPVGTAVVNVCGAIALGLVAGADPSEGAMRVLGVGLLGGFTTFSTWMVDTWALTGPTHRHRAEAFVNLAVVLAGGWIGFVAAGRVL